MRRGQAMGRGDRTDMLQGMAQEYETLRRGVDDAMREDDGPLYVTHGRMWGDPFEQAPTKQDMVIGAAAAGLCVAGLAALAVTGAKALGLVRYL